MRLRNRFNTTHNFKHRAARHLLAQHLTDKMLHVFDPSRKRETIDTLLKLNPVIWNKALSNEIGRLAQGIGDIT